MCGSDRRRVCVCLREREGEGGREEEGREREVLEKSNTHQKWSEVVA